MKRTALIILLFFVCAFHTACQENGEASDDADAGDGADAPGDTDGEETGFPHQSMFEAVLAFLEENAVLVEGNWEDDFGDASFFGPTFDYTYGLDRDDEDYIARALATADFVVVEIERSVEDAGYLLDHLDDTAMGQLGLIEIARLGADEKYQQAAGAMLVKSNQVAAAFDYYVLGSIDNYAVRTYGPTVVTALLGLMNLQYVLNLEDPRNEQFRGTGLHIVEAIYDMTWDPELGGYRYAPDNEKLYLYPNIIMMLILNRAYELTGDESYLEKAEALFDAIQPLRVEEMNCYYTPYSAEVMGARTEEYYSLSPHNYLAFALVLMFENSGEQKYLNEAYLVLDFIEQYLHVEGQVLHHWMDGRRAVPEDPEYYCPGCNLQLLYLLWYLDGVQG